MLGKPHIVERSAQTYAAVRKKIAMNELTKVADAMSSEFFAWLAKRSIQPAGAPFFKYNSISDNGQLEIEWGAPVPPGVVSDDVVLTDTLPAGRYASVMHTGSFKELRDANGALLEWIEENNLELDEHRVESGDAFVCRLEIYHTNPRAEPNSSKWQTEITIRLADEM